MSDSTIICNYTLDGREMHSLAPFTGNSAKYRGYKECKGRKNEAMSKRGTISKVKPSCMAENMGPKCLAGGIVIRANDMLKVMGTSGEIGNGPPRVQSRATGFRRALLPVQPEN